jgi:AraC family ethanolamine operon transcriptional activator
MNEDMVDVLPALPINRFRTGDIDEHARNMGGWQVSYDQLTPGHFEGELIEFRSEWMQLVRDRSNQAMTKRGMAWDGAITFSVPLSSDGPVFCSGHPIVEPSLMVARGRNLPDLRTPQHLDLLARAAPFELPIFPSVTVSAIQPCRLNWRPCSMSWKGAGRDARHCWATSLFAVACATR